MNRTYLVLPAAGSGERMGGRASGCSKVLLSMGEGLSVIELALRSFAHSGVLDGVVVASRAEDSSTIESLCRSIFPKLDVLVVLGGSSRQESVYRCLLAVEAKADYVLVHDAARPFCSPSLIRKAAECAYEHQSCLLAIPVKPTLKKVVDGLVQETIPRALFYEAQTPQAFSYTILREAHETAIKQNLVGTDDSQLVENLGFNVRIVEGSDQNIKITTQQDLLIAETMLGSVAKMLK